MKNKCQNETVDTALKQSFENLEKELGGDLLVINSGLSDGLESLIKKLIEELQEKDKPNKKLFVLLTTTGGSLNPVQKMVQIFRHFYNEVNYIVSDYAYSAGTILCMSGDNIYMDYYSNLGPIDPQVVTKDKKYVSALGYLDKINEMLLKAKNQTLTDPEFIILKEFDLAELRYYEMIKELAVDLLKNWLTHYKFKNWKKHSDGREVTLKEKIDTAEKIASTLSDNKKWKSHGRPISMETLCNDLNLKIIDFGKNQKLNKKINDYCDKMRQFLFSKKNKNYLIQTSKTLL